MLELEFLKNKNTKIWWKRTCLRLIFRKTATRNMSFGRSFFQTIWDMRNVITAPPILVMQSWNSVSISQFHCQYWAYNRRVSTYVRRYISCRVAYRILCIEVGILFAVFQYRVPVTTKQCRQKLREKFMENKDLSDLRAIDISVIKVRMDNTNSNSIS